MKKGNAALLVALGGLKKPKGEPAEDSEEMTDEGDDEMEASDPIGELASLMGVEDVEAFKEMFKSAVNSCGGDEY